MSALTIYVTGGFAQYADITVVDTTGKDISASTFALALSTSGSQPPTTGWVAPDASAMGATPNIRELKMLVTNAVAPGVYYLWAKFTSNPEIVPMRRITTITVV